MAQLAAVFIHHAEIHEQMRAQHVELEVGTLHVERGFVAHLLEQRIRQATGTKSFRRVEQRRQARGRLRQRHKAAARALVQALEQRLDLVLEHAGHQPLAALIAHLVEHEQRDGHGDAVARVARLVQVGSGAVHTTQAHGLGKRVAGDAGRLVAHELFAGELEQIRLLFGLLAVPGFKAVAVADVRRQLLVVERVDELIVHQHVLAARLVLKFFDLGDELLVGGQKRQLGLPIATHQRLADEDLARGVRIDLAEVDAPAAVDHDAIERGPLQRRDLCGLLLPVRVEQLLFQQMAAYLLDPLGLDGGDAAAEQARGLHQFSRHDPAPGLLGQVGARVFIELDAACAQVPVFLLAARADVAQQPGQHRQVQLLIARRLRVDGPLVLGHHGEQLGVDVTPLTQTADADEVLAQQLLVLAVAQLVGGRGSCGAGHGGRGSGHSRSHQPLRHGQVGLRRCALVRHGLLCAGRRQRGRAASGLVDPLPQFEVAAELALLVVELGMRLVGLLLRFHGPVAHVLHAERAGNHQHLFKRLAVARLQDHATHPRVERQARQLHAHGREFVGLVHRAQFGQQLVAVGNRAARGGFDERELHHVAQVQRLHAQDHARERAAQDFRISKARSGVEVRLVVQAYADAVGHAATAACALVGRGLADGLDQQLLYLAAKAVALDAGGARIDHVADARHRERGLGHVGGEHQAAAGVAVEDAVLLGLRQAGEQRQHLGIAHHGLVGQVLAQVVRGLADLALARQEDQDVAPCIALPEFVHAIGNGFVQAVVARVFKRAPALLHRKGAARHVNDGRWAFGGFKVLGKAIGINRGRCHHHLEVWPARQDLADVAQQEVDVEAALVRLVNDDGVVVLEQRIGLRLGQQDTVGHELDGSIAGEAVLKTHLEAHHVAQRGLELFGNALGHAAGRNAPRLGVADELALLPRLGVALAPAQRQRDLGQLGGFARPRLAADDNHLVLLDRGHDLFALARYGQGLGKLDGETAGRRRRSRRRLWRTLIGRRHGAQLSVAPPPGPAPGCSFHATNQGFCALQTLPRPHPLAKIAPTLRTPSCTQRQPLARGPKPWRSSICLPFTPHPSDHSPPPRLDCVRTDPATAPRAFALHRPWLSAGVFCLWNHAHECQKIVSGLCPG